MDSRFICRDFNATASKPFHDKTIKAFLDSERENFLGNEKECKVKSVVNAHWMGN